MDKFQKLKKSVSGHRKKNFSDNLACPKRKTQYNPNLVHIYDPVKVEHKIKYHEKEIEKAKASL